MFWNLNVHTFLLFLLPLCFSVAGVLDLGEFRNEGVARGAVFKQAYLDKEGIFHLHDDADGSFNNGFKRSLTKEELDGFRGKYLKYSCHVKQDFASALDCVGISAAVRMKSGRWLSRSARTRTRGRTGWETLETGLFIPEDAVSGEEPFLC